MRSARQSRAENALSANYSKMRRFDEPVWNWLAHGSAVSARRPS